MFYKHWKKIALALTALFWTGCEDSASSAVCLYGPDPNYSSATENPVSSSSETTKTSSSSVEESSSSSEFLPVPVYGVIACTPMDSSVTYFAEDYSAETQKMWKEQEANRDAVGKIDSIKQTLTESPMCLEHLRMQLDRFVALYGAPTIIRNAVESCDDGTTRPSEEYARFLKMQEEWEANKPALDEELQKVYEDKMKEIEERINKCLSGEAGK